MKNALLVCLGLLGFGRIFSQSSSVEPSIIPEPVKLVKTTGYYVLPKNVSIEISSIPELKETSNILQQRLSQATGAHVTLSATNPAAGIRLILNKAADNTIGIEGYNLSVTSKGVVIRANAPAGLFYGVQSLLQLFPKEIEGKVLAKNIVWEAPAVEITDYPRFGWRGLMFDVCRHFFTRKDVMSFIDEMVKYKFNLLHFQLTND